MPSTKILSQLAVDDALVQDAKYRFDPADRQYIDEQIRGVETHLVNALIRGRCATYFRVDGSASTLVPGDVVCSWGSSQGDITVGRALAAKLAIGGPIGVVVIGAPPGGNALVAFGGVLPPSITGLSPASTQYLAVVDPSTGRIYTSAGLSYGDYAVGLIDKNGFLRVYPNTVAAQLPWASPIVAPILTYNGMTAPANLPAEYTGQYARTIGLAVFDDGTSSAQNFITQQVFTSNTASTAQIDLGTVSNVYVGESIAIDAIVTCRTSGSGFGRYKRSACFQRIGSANPTIVGTVESGTDQGSGATAVTIGATSSYIAVKVTPSDATTRTWFCEIRAQRMGA